MCITVRLWTGNRAGGVPFPGIRDFSLLHKVQTSSKAHSNPTEDCFAVGRAAAA
jgi:hypothetical protein